MSIDLKLQLFFAILLAFTLLGSYMLIIRTIATLEYAVNRLEEMVQMEIVLAKRHNNQTALAKNQADAREKEQNQRNELLLNIPFLEKLREDNKTHGR